MTNNISRVSGTLSFRQIADLLTNMRLSSYGMPVGWSYDGKFSCGCEKSVMDVVR